MASITKHLLLGALLFLMLLTHLYITEAGVGICYGRNGDNLPSPQDTINMCKSRGITKLRIYGPDHDIFEALKGSNIELSLTVNTDSLQPIGANPAAATGWIRDVVVPYASTINFRYIIVGNEIDPNGPLAGSILPGMQNVLNALRSFNLADRIKVTTSIATSLIANSWPPSAAVFSPQSQGFIHPIINFLQDNGSPLMANIYTFFPRRDNPGQIGLDYALFTSPGIVFTDPNNGLQYQNLFDAMLDGLYAAIDKVGARDNAAGKNLKVHHSEGGWAFSAALDASPQNACTFYSNMISHAKKGTPLRPEPFDTYLFSMFDENRKNPEVEKHFGIFNNNLTPKCNLIFNSKLESDDLADVSIQKNKAEIYSS